MLVKKTTKNTFLLLALSMAQLSSNCCAEDTLAPIPIMEIGSWGYIDRTGKTIIGPRYNSATPFKNGFASVCPTGKSRASNAFRIIIDRSGKPLSPLLFNEPGTMNDGFLAVNSPFVSPEQSLPEDRRRTYATYLSKSGSILQKKYNVCGSFYSGVAVCRVHGNVTPTHPIDERHKNGSPSSKSEAFTLRSAEPYNDHFLESSLVLIDRQQNIVRPISEEPAHGEYDFSEGMLPIEVLGQYGFIDTKGKLAVPARFAKCSKFRDGLSAVKLDAGWGFIDKLGKEVIPCIYKRVSSFQCGLAKVETFDEKVAGFIDRNNKFAFLIESYDDCSDFSEGFAVLRNLKRESVVIDKQGHHIYTTRKSVGEFHEGLCSAAEYRNGVALYGYLDKHFQWAIQPQFVEAAAFSDGLAAVCFYDPVKAALQKRAEQEQLRIEKLENPSWRRRINEFIRQFHF